MTWEELTARCIWTWCTNTQRSNLTIGLKSARCLHLRWCGSLGCALGLQWIVIVAQGPLRKRVMRASDQTQLVYRQPYFTLLNTWKHQKTLGEKSGHKPLGQSGHKPLFRLREPLQPPNNKRHLGKRAVTNRWPGSSNCRLLRWNYIRIW